MGSSVGPMTASPTPGTANAAMLAKRPADTPAAVKAKFVSKNSFVASPPARSTSIL